MSEKVYNVKLTRRMLVALHSHMLNTIDFGQLDDTAPIVMATIAIEKAEYKSQKEE